METMLRLLVPLGNEVHTTFRSKLCKLKSAAGRIIHLVVKSVGVKGGAHQGRGGNQHELMTRTCLCPARVACLRRSQTARQPTSSRAADLLVPPVSELLNC